MKVVGRGTVLLIAGMLIAPATWRAAGQALPAPPRKIDFAREIAPLFQKRCYGCHGPQLQTSGLRLDNSSSALRGGNSGPVILPGNGAASPLVRRISGSTDVKPMPPAGPRLSLEEIAAVRAWIDQGAV